MSLRNRAIDKVIRNGGILVVGNRMKRGACECTVYREADNTLSPANRKRGAASETDSELPTLKAQRVNVAYVAPGQALIVPPSDLLLRTTSSTRAHVEKDESDANTASSITTSVTTKGAIVMNNAQIIRNGKFARDGSSFLQLCPHRFVCPRCQWQHLDPNRAPLLKLARAKSMLEEVMLRQKAREREVDNNTNTHSKNKTTNAALSSTPPLNASIHSSSDVVEWLPPLPFTSSHVLRSRSVTLYFGVNANGAYTLGVPVSDFFSGTRGDDNAVNGGGGTSIHTIPTVESIADKCLILSATMREVVQKVGKLWATDGSLRGGAGGDGQNFAATPSRSLKSITLIESPAVRSMVARLVVWGHDADSNALRSYADASDLLSSKEGKLVDAILKSCIVCDGGVSVEVFIEGKALQPSGDSTRAMQRQLYPRTRAVKVGESANAKGSSASPLSTLTANSVCLDVMNVLVPTSKDGSSQSTMQLKVPLHHIVAGTGQGMYRFVGGIESAVTAVMALASQAGSAGEDEEESLRKKRHVLVDFPHDALSPIVLSAARHSGLWLDDGDSDGARNILSAEAYTALTRDAIEALSPTTHFCFLTRVCSGSSRRAQRSMAALDTLASRHRSVRGAQGNANFHNTMTIALCEDAEAMHILFKWLLEKGIMRGGGAQVSEDADAAVTVAIVDVDPMSHHFCAIVQWHGFGGGRGSVIGLPSPSKAPFRNRRDESPRSMASPPRRSSTPTGRGNLE